MANELEKQFFDTFGIEPRDHKGCSWGGYCPFEEHIDCGECSYWETWKTDYPQLTDTHYLKLICELSKCKAYFNNFYRLQNVDIEQLKEQVLTDCIFQAIFFKNQVQALFEEG